MNNPNSRREAFLAKMAGLDVPCPEPATREEMYLAACAENTGGGSGGGTFYADVEWDDDYTQLTAHTTYEEIFEAYEKGMNVRLRCNNGQSHVYYYDMCNMESYNASFSSTTVSDSYVTFETIEIFSEESVDEGTAVRYYIHEIEYNS